MSGKDKGSEFLKATEQRAVKMAEEVTSFFEKKGGTFVEGLKAGGKKVTAKMTAQEEQAQDPQEVADSVMTFLKDKQYKKAGQHLAHQINLAVKNSGIPEAMQSVAHNVSNFFENLTNDPQKMVAEKLNKLAESCDKYKNNGFMAALGKVCKGFATIVEHPGQALQSMQNMVKDNIAKVCEFAQGLTPKGKSR